MSSQTTITFWKNAAGKIIHISEVSSGINCWAFCIATWERLIARKWEINSHHFARPANFNAEYYRETLTHHFAKQYFLDKKIISLPYFLSRPEYFFMKNLDNSSKQELKKLMGMKNITTLKKIDQTKVFELKNIEIEKRIQIWSEYIVADIYGEIHTETLQIPLIIEILVSHACDDIKLQKLKNSEYFLLEINCNIYDDEILSKKDWITDFLDKFFQNRPGDFLYMPEEIRKSILEFNKWLFSLKQKIRSIQMENIQKQYKENEKKLLNIPGIITKSSPIPKMCPIRQKVYKKALEENKSIIENSLGIKKILSGDICWDFSIIGKNISDSYIIVNEQKIYFNEKMSWKNMWAEGGKKFLIFRKMVQDFIRYQNYWKMIKTYRNGSRVNLELTNCVGCKYYRNYSNVDDEIIDSCRYNVEN